MTKTIEIGRTKFDGPIGLHLDKANRHGLVTGATGTGKTVTLQRLAEQFSAVGVPVFAADAKGDLSGIATNRPTRFYDLFGEHGARIRTSVQEIGPDLLASMLRINDTQMGALQVAFKKAEHEQSYLMGLDDLRWALNDMSEEREAVCKQYGNVTAASMNTIQRQILALEAQGGGELFGEPRFDIADLLHVDDTGQGIVSLLHADQLMEAPKLYATFLLWLLTELFRVLPECGDLTKPKLVFFFDEAHLLFNGAPKLLLEKIERLVRLVRSKGVGVYFVTQSPMDVPPVVLSQLGNRVQHALRAYTPNDQRMVKASAKAFRPNPDIDVEAEITGMGVGFALVSVLDDAGIPTVVEKVKICKPDGQIGAIDDEHRAAIRSTQDESADMDDATMNRAFQRRMKIERGIDPGPEVEPEPYEPGIYREYVPEVSAPPEARSIMWPVLQIIGGVILIAACAPIAIGMLG